jgi:hypothetical protein
LRPLELLESLAFKPCTELTNSAVHSS